MRIVPIEYAVNQILAETVFDTNGQMLIRKESYLNENVILKIKASGIFSVYVNDRFSKNTLKPPISDHLRNATIMEMVKVFESARKYESSGKKNSKELEKQLDKLISSARDIMFELDTIETYKINFTDIKSITTYTYAHPINVAVLSYILGRKLKYDPKQLEDLFIGALFEDIGMCFINENLFMKQGKLDVKEFLKVKEHPQRGYDFINDFYFANTYIKMIVLQHQEKIDGSGYPNKSKADEIHPFAKLVAVADVYDAMTSDRVYARANSSSEAIEYIMGAAGRHFDFEFAREFVNTIVPYPEGSLVKLNTGHTALVTKTNHALPLRPCIKLIDPGRRILEKSEVDLTEEKNLVVEGLEYICP